VQIVERLGSSHVLCRIASVEQLEAISIKHDM
jgi:hypothetical protein